MTALTTIGALMELVHGTNWMRTAIPNISQPISSAHDLLKAFYTKHGTQKSFRLVNRPISAWGHEHLDSFTTIIPAIKDQATLIAVDPKQRHCLFTDASELCWSGTL